MLARPRSYLRLVAALCVVMGMTPAHSATEPLDTVVVKGKPNEVIRREIETFVGNVTRLDGQLIGRWRGYVCPIVAGVSDPQAEFVRQRIIEVYDTVRKKQRKPGQACTPNIFVIITPEADQVIAEWKERDPGMFRWKSREGVLASKGPGAVRTWHNATENPSAGDPLIESSTAPPQGTMSGSRIVSDSAEGITAVVVLVDANATGKVTLAQLTDYITMVSLAQLDLSADLGSINSILRMFAEPRPAEPPLELTPWDYAFLKALYRTSYEPKNQRGDIRARMGRELAPR
jgi:hypothetical protein